MTRLAPSPTGALHLGNARTFLLTWLMARQAGGRIILRIEDLDGPRVKPGAIESTLRVLRALGIDWDGEMLVQSHDLAPYVDAMNALARRGLVYPSDATRAEIEAAASAPQEGVHEIRFPEHLRPAERPAAFDRPESSWRFVTPPGAVRFVDRFAGPCAPDPGATVGDFVVWTKRAQPSYQLAVVVDDARQGVTEVIRGDDLIDSAGRQLLLYRALNPTFNLGPEPRHTHLPIVKGPDGKRLAKRHGDTRVETYLDAGVRPEKLVGLLAFWSGLVAQRQECSAVDLLPGFELGRVPRESITFTPEDDRWLRA
ncbi:MAG: glutamate--tRNA ligase family protein [Planctomycetota bacterium]|nr:glutamate--tRNA ligase family protein [Planctomycetota bacterium]